MLHECATIGSRNSSGPSRNPLPVEVCGDEHIPHVARLFHHESKLLGQGTTAQPRLLGYSCAVDDTSLPKPEHLAPPKLEPKDWIRIHGFGLAALLVGVAAFIVVTILQRTLWSQPDWRITVPLFVVATALGATSIARKEGSYGLPLLGIALAAAAMVMGWFLIMAIVIAVTAIIILIMSHVM